MHTEREKALQRIEKARSKRPSLILIDDLYISTENKKLKNTLIFSLPAIVTCTKATNDCMFYCYAKKSEIAFHNVIEARIRNLDQSKLDTFEERINERIKKLSKQMATDEKTKIYFRIHESGDFYSQDYLNKWTNIVKANKKVKFNVYTRSTHLDFSEIKQLKNIKIRFSIDHETKPNDAIKQDGISRAYVKTEQTEQKYKEIEKAFKCTPNMECGPCRICWNTDQEVAFTLH